jgi:hypothetical protein
MDFKKFLQEVEYPEQLVEDNMTSITIDLNMAKKETLNESLFHAFASITKWLVKTTMGIDFDKWNIPVKMRGTPNQINAFKRAMKGERKYMQAAKKYGLNNPRTYKSSYRLKKATANFERTTGMKWPIH